MSTEVGVEAGIETFIAGDPGSVAAAADWVGYTLAPPVYAGAESLRAARRDAAADWQGDAAEAFDARMRTGFPRAENLNVDIVALAREIEAYGNDLRLAQERMATVRTKAIAAGLLVEGTIIRPPGPAPADPGPPPFDSYSGLRLIAHQDAMLAFQNHQRMAQAYGVAAGDAAFAREQLEAAQGRVGDTYRGLQGPEWVLNAAEIAGGVAAGAMQFNANALRETAKRLNQQAAVTLARALADDPAIVGRSSIYRDLERAEDLRRQAGDATRRADDLLGRSKHLDSPLRLGAALAIAGIGYELYRGKDPTQAVVVGGGGFLATVGATALVASVIPVPGVSTAVGAVVGVGIGIVTSGALDSMFENGPSVESAWNGGKDAAVDTGKAVVGAAVGLGRAIGLG